MTILKHCWSSPKKSPPLYIPQQNTYQNLRQQIFSWGGFGFGSGEKKKNSHKGLSQRSCSRCHKTIFPSVVTQPASLSVYPIELSTAAARCFSCSSSPSQRRRKKKGHLSTVRTDIVNGPFPRWRFKDVIENLYSFPSFDVVLEQFPSQLFLSFSFYFMIGRNLVATSSSSDEHMMYESGNRTTTLSIIQGQQPTQFKKQLLTTGPFFFSSTGHAIDLGYSGTRK